MAACRRMCGRCGRRCQRLAKGKRPPSRCPPPLLLPGITHTRIRRIRLTQKCCSVLPVVWLIPIRCELPQHMPWGGHSALPQSLGSVCRATIGPVWWDTLCCPERRSLPCWASTATPGTHCFRSHLFTPVLVCGQVNKDRFISKLFLRGDSVILGESHRHVVSGSRIPLIVYCRLDGPYPNAAHVCMASRIVLHVALPLQNFKHLRSHEPLAHPCQTVILSQMMVQLWCGITGLCPLIYARLTNVYQSCQRGM